MTEGAVLSQIETQLKHSKAGIASLQAQLKAYAQIPEGDRTARTRLCTLIRSVKHEIYRLDGIALCALDAARQ